MKVRHVDIQVVRGDIMALDVEAIVNPANTQLVMGGGLAAAIKSKGGVQIEAEAVSQGPIMAGQVISTSGGALKAKHVIHAATMDMDFQTDEHLVRAATANAFKVAAQLGLKSIAVPAMGCGVGRFPLVACAKILTQEALRVAREGGTTLTEIIFCLHDDEAYGIFEKHVYGYLRHIMEDLAWGPYVTADIIIEIHDGIVIIERTNPPFGWALPGGFVDRGESLETAARREAKEETGLDLEDLKQFHTYSDPSRDPRFYTVTAVFTAKGIGTPAAGDDAKGLRVIPLGDLRKFQYAFDHNQVIEEYLRSRGK